MQQLASVWLALEPRRRIIVVLATLAMFAAVLMLSRVASTPSMSLLYAGLQGSAAGDVVTALEQRGVAYEVRGDAIYVDGSQRDELRMTLAAQGLPASAGSGYELLDGMSGFGTTSQMFDAAYWRAKEGELARTIVSNPQIRAARVHIANIGNQPFRRDMKPTASVMVTTAAGTLSGATAKALKYMIASAIAGMRPEDVSVIDSQGGLILGGDEAGPGLYGTDRAAELKRNVEQLLGARVGYGNAVVEVSVDTQTDRESITEKTIDPNSRIAISTDTTETNTSAKDQKPGGVTVASNLPSGDSAAGGTSQSTNAETRSRTNFEVSAVERLVERVPGAVKRITVAVLVDGVRSTDAGGVESFAARPDDELLALRDLVAAAVGFDEQRGDVITIKSMQFELAPLNGTLAEPSFFGSLGLNGMTLIQLAILSVVALLLGLFVVRPILTSAPRTQAGDAGAAALPAPRRGEYGALTGEIDDGSFDGSDLPVISFDDDLPMFGDVAAADADPVARLRRLIEDRQEESVEILRSWMEDTGEKA